MFRWLKKRRQKCDKLPSVAKRDEYGFDLETSENVSWRRVEHIYEEIPDLPRPKGSLECRTKGKRPALPPRNEGRTAKHRATYSKWRSQTLSMKSLSLPDLADAVSDLDESGTSPLFEQTKESIPKPRRVNSSNTQPGHRRRTLSQTSRSSQEGLTPNPACPTLFSEDVSGDFDQNVMSGFDDRHYFPLESDSGYDYSGSSSNGSDVNDSGIGSSYEFHLSKAEQLRRLENEIHNLSLQCNLSQTDEKLPRRHSVLLRSRDRKPSVVSLTSNTSMTSDLDLDDELSAYGEMVDLSSTEDCRHFPRATMPRKRIPKSVLVRTSQNYPACKSRPSVAPAAQCRPVISSGSSRMSNRQTSVQREGTPRYQRPKGTNRLLGDLIRKNNDNLFFA